MTSVKFIDMAKITIDGKEYESNDLSTSAQQQLGSLQFTQNEIKRTEAHMAVLKTAAAAYSTALKNELES